MIGIDGRRRKIQSADTQGLLRFIQSIPSKKAEPFKLWLAKTGSLDYKYLPKEVKAVLDDLTAEAIKTVPAFANHHNSLLKDIKKACQLYGNSEAGITHKIEAAEKKLYTDLGLMCGNSGLNSRRVCNSLFIGILPFVSVEAIKKAAVLFVKTKNTAALNCPVV